MRAYWKAAIRRAAVEAACSLNIQSRGALMLAGLGIIIAVAALAFWGSSDASRDEAIVRFAVAGTIIGLFPLVFLWKLIGVPPALQAEQQMECASLVAEKDNQITKLSTVRNRQQLLDEIAALRSELAGFLIAMDKDRKGTKTKQEWAKEFSKIEDPLAEKIEALAGRAEAEVFKRRGNVLNTTPMLHPHYRLLDICVHDLDHLKELIAAYSRKSVGG